jgi:D-threo-aldose 1-dehydrogenase
MVGGVMNSGVLAHPGPDARFDYLPAPPDIIERAQRIAAVCARHAVPVRDAAIQFPLAHPAVVSLIAGVRRIDHLDEYPAAMRRDIPSALWDDLRSEGLIAADAPVPSAASIDRA